jgi:hypothetical protein
MVIRVYIPLHVSTLTLIYICVCMYMRAYVQMTSPEDKRQIRALAITSDVKRINKLRYRVKSESGEDKWYDVVKRYGHNLGGHQEGEWTCSCADFTYRRIDCKHIFVVLFKTRLRKKIVQPEVVVEQSSLPTISQPLKCPKCDSSRIIKKGIRRAPNLTQFNDTNANRVRIGLLTT